jgi:hypothetical protein
MGGITHVSVNEYRPLHKTKEVTVKREIRWRTARYGVAALMASLVAVSVTACSPSSNARGLDLLDGEITWCFPIEAEQNSMIHGFRILNFVDESATITKTSLVDATNVTFGELTMLPSTYGSVLDVEPPVAVPDEVWLARPVLGTDPIVVAPGDTGQRLFFTVDLDPQAQEGRGTDFRIDYEQGGESYSYQTRNYGYVITRDETCE